MKRLKKDQSVTKTYDNLIQMGYQWATDKKVDLYELKKRLYLAMVTVNILEGLRFYVSFACSFVFGELKNLWKVVQKYIIYCKR